MSFDQQLTWPFPVKGKDQNFAYREEPSGTCAECKNVVPHDPVTARTRGGQRGGLSKLFTTFQLAGPPQLLMQATTALDPTTVVANTRIYQELFTEFTNNELLSGTGIWQVFRTDPLTGVTPDTAAKVVIGGTPPAYATNFGTQSPFSGTFALYNGSALSYGSVFRFQIKGIYNTIASAFVAEFVIQYQAVGGTGNFIIAKYHLTGSTWAVELDDLKPSGGAFFTNTVLTGNPVNTGDPFDFSVMVNQTTSTTAYTLYVNGIQVGFFQNATNPGYQTQTQWGWALVDTTGSPTQCKVTEVDVYINSRATYRANNLIAVANGNIYVGDVTGFAVASSGTGALNAGVPCSGAAIDGKVYITDGTNIKVLTLQTKTVSTYAATVGSAPAHCTLVAIYRGRLVLAAPTDGAQNWFMSRVGVYTDWSFGDTDSARAIAGNSGAGFGKIGDPITALMGFGDDVLLFGGDHQIWAMMGDPAAGGTLDHFSDGVGVFGKDAWTMDPMGTIYFVGHAGFYRLPKGATSPENLSRDVIAQYFDGINRLLTYTMLEWDRDRHVCWICNSNVAPNLPVPSIHMVWDSRTGGFFPQEFPDNMDPTQMTLYDGDTEDTRFMLFGSRDGWLRQQLDTNTDDDGQGINSFVLLGPYRPVDDLTEAKCMCVDFYVGQEDQSKSYSLTAQLQSGPDAYAALFAPTETATVTFGQVSGHLGRQHALRLKGGSFAMLLSCEVTSSTWNMERIILMIGKGGKQR